nr:undecaprenyl-diphosphatase [Alsobacter ponti]
MLALNERIFLLLNASAHPQGATVSLANFVSSDLVLGVALLLVALWAWGNHDKRAALLATAAATVVALGVNQLLGQLWYEPRPFMVGLGHTLAAHAPENSFPSDHGTFVFTVGLALIATGASWRWGVLVSAVGVAVAWARIYLGLHFPIDMLSSAVVAGACSGLAAAFRRPVGHFAPFANRIYDQSLDLLRFPPAWFPRTRNRA